MTRTFIYLAGADGTGKSTQSQLLLQRFASLHIPCRHLWLRYPFLLSLPLLAYARWRGYSWHEVNDGLDHGYWFFEHSWLLCRALPLTALVDAALASLLAVYLPLWMGTTIVCERYVLDIVVDLAIATGTLTPDSWVFQSLRKLLPRGTLVIGLSAPEHLLASRRPGLEYDRRLGAKLAAYEGLFRAIACPVISTTGSISGVHEQIWRLVSACCRP